MLFEVHAEVRRAGPVLLNRGLPDERAVPRGDAHEVRRFERTYADAAEMHRRDRPPLRRRGRLARAAFALVRNVVSDGGGTSFIVRTSS